MNSLFHLRSSDGSTETLSVMETEDSGACSDLQTDSDTVPSSLPSSAESQPSQHAAEGSELDPEYRSLSMDSAYGTLSPELQLDLQTQTPASEQESTEEETEADSGEVAAEDKKKEDEEEEESDDRSSSGSRISVESHLKPRRRPPVQSRMHCLKNLVNKCHSEDNLLQRVNGEDTQGTGEEVTQGSHAPYQLGLDWAEGLAHSKSLTELNVANTKTSYQRETERTRSDRLAHSLPSYVLRNTLRRRNYRKGTNIGAMDHTGSDGEISLPEPQEGNCGASKDEAGSGKNSQQHKKLTLAQIYKIRTTLVLNSTLTAS